MVIQPENGWASQSVKLSLSLLGWNRARCSGTGRLCWSQWIRSQLASGCLLPAVSHFPKHNSLFSSSDGRREDVREKKRGRLTHCPEFINQPELLPYFWLHLKTPKAKYWCFCTVSNYISMQMFRYTGKKAHKTDINPQGSQHHVLESIKCCLKNFHIWFETPTGERRWSIKVYQATK